ncbi:hypothetical protein KCV03_g394, partial [Aureobasidium melanogenum]
LSSSLPYAAAISIRAQVEDVVHCRWLCDSMWSFVGSGAQQYAQIVLPVTGSSVSGPNGQHIHFSRDKCNVFSCLCQSYLVMKSGRSPLPKASAIALKGAGSTRKIILVVEVAKLDIRILDGTTSLHATAIRDGILEVEELAKIGFFLQGRHVVKGVRWREKKNHNLSRIMKEEGVGRTVRQIIAKQRRESDHWLLLTVEYLLCLEAACYNHYKPWSETDYLVREIILENRSESIIVSCS